MDRLKAKRGARRAQVTKLVDEVNERRQDLSTSKAILNGLLARLESSGRDLRKVNEETEPLIREDDLLLEYEAVFRYEESAANAIAELRTRIADIELNDRRTNATPTVKPSAAQTKHQAQVGIKLPKLQLMTFAGELTQWQPFWEQFRTAVHENRRLNKTEKFQYLSTSLKGRAAAAIRGLQATESCYDDAIEILSQRFGDTTQIEREYLSRLRSLPAVRSSRDVAGLRSLYNYVQANVRCLKSLGVSTNSFASMMVDILLSAIPPEMVVEYHRTANYGALRTASNDTYEHGSLSPSTEARAASGPGTTDELSKVLNFIRIELESLERAGLKDSRMTHVAQSTNRTWKRSVPTGAILQAAVKAVPNCFFCSSSDHSTAECDASLPLTEKLKILSKASRCFRCTKRGHRSKECRANVTCSHCKKRHASVVCDPSKLQTKGIDSVPLTNLMTVSTHRTQHQEPDILLQTVRIWVSSGTACTQLRGIIDGGSQGTFVRDDVAKKLNLKVVGESRLHLNTFASDTSTRKTHQGKVVELRLRSQYHPAEHVIHATTIPFICKDLAEIPSNQEFVASLRRQREYIGDDMLYPNLQCENGIPLLIGSDEMWKLLTGQVKRYPGDERLVAIGTVFGWTFQGPSPSVRSYTDNSTTAVCVLKIGVATEQEPDILEKFWKLECIGISEETTSNKEYDAGVLQDFQQNLRFVDGRYEVALPWKPDAEFEDNFGTARKRLQSLTRRLLRDDSMQEYDEVIRAYLQNGHAEKVTTETLSSGRVFYMPHRAVSESTTTKVRVVFDASSHAVGATSLNDHLEKGPKLTPDLVHILLRFRMYRVAITADIQKASLQIGIREADRDALRFLWLAESPTPGSMLPDFECWRMTRVPFGTSASPFLLNATLRHHLTSVEGPDKDLAYDLSNSFYVDDLLIGTDTVNEGKQLITKTQEILHKAV
ncbi:uncharacterized protein LOC135372760 [Ornithodoros turicata]|uniref:uncharacterized protein LOC135372760 n=1 Tax=Ornithodoros turicata TaxID=34597 RepID=UPI003139E727